MLISAPSTATMFIAYEEDLRGVHTFDEGREGEINSIGGSIRKVLSDRRGDRLILFLQAEAAHNLAEGLLHQAYAEWKGPMGRWNLALGRVPLAWGLLTDWSPDRMLFRSPYSASRTFSSDNGVLFRGTLGMWDYGLAATQGYGMGTVKDFPGPGSVTGRLGVTPGVSGDFTAGLSATTGTVYASEHGHGMGAVMKEERTALALDGTLYMGMGLYRVEGGARRTGGKWYETLFLAADYAVLPRLSVQLAGQGFRTMPGEPGDPEPHLDDMAKDAGHGQSDSRLRGWGYAGVSVPAGTLTIRAGYEYENTHTDTHRILVQLHRMFAASR